jgi:hypothetical protein
VNPVAVALGVSVLGWKGALLGAAWLAVRHAVRRRPRVAALADDEIDTLALVTLIAVRAGLSVPASLDRAAEALGERHRAAVTPVLRRARAVGLATALASDPGPLRPMSAGLARSMLAGSSPVPALSEFLARRRSEARARALAEARTLPVRLSGPVSLLLLPGFLGVVVAPGILAEIESFLAGVAP